VKAFDKKFDKKFGDEFISALPTSPGIYQVYDSDGVLIYVGKAKNLRRRLSQYRNAKRRKKHLKMRSIVSEAAEIRTRLFPNELEACLAETQIIQSERPKWNVEGAFYFLYPMMGVGYRDGVLSLLYTTEPDTLKDVLDPDVLTGLQMHGAYRSRFLCGNAFFALMECLEFIGHKNKTQKPGKHSYLYSFRMMSESWKTDLDRLFRGEGSEAFENLVLSLVENAAARRKPKKIQRLLNDIKRFWRHEAQLLYRVRTRVCAREYPVPQRGRDLLFVEHRYGALSRNTVAMSSRA
jgi:predicted GIY-YIG superfamily endonuclease